MQQIYIPRPSQTYQNCDFWFDNANTIWQPWKGNAADGFKETLKSRLPNTKRHRFEKRVSTVDISMAHNGTPSNLKTFSPSTSRWHTTERHRFEKRFHRRHLDGSRQNAIDSKKTFPPSTSRCLTGRYAPRTRMEVTLFRG
jgi:hypothetical protein